MNKKLSNLIITGALSLAILTPINNQAYAMENESGILSDNIKSSIEIQDENGNIVNNENIIVTYELKDVEIEDASTLINTGLLEKDYKTKMLEESKSRGSKSAIVWYEHPVKHTVTATGVDVTSGKKIYSASATATMTANSSKNLKVAISLGTISNYNGYTTTKGSLNNGSYVSKGGTSTATQNISTKKSGNIVVKVTNPQFRVKHNGYATGNAQVAFGIQSTLSW